jgi:hypothetical protein
VSDERCPARQRLYESADGPRLTSYPAMQHDIQIACEEADEMADELATLRDKLAASEARAERMEVALRMEVRWYDGWLDGFHPDDATLKRACELAHGKRIARLRAALAAAPQTMRSGDTLTKEAPTDGTK